MDKFLEFTDDEIKLIRQANDRFSDLHWVDNLKYLGAKGMSYFRKRQASFDEGAYYQFIYDIDLSTHSSITFRDYDLSDLLKTLNKFYSGQKIAGS